MRTLLVLTLLPLLACQPATEPSAADEPVATRSEALIGAVSGEIPAGLPARLTVGLLEDIKFTWMRDSGVAWDLRYRYFTKGWVDNWGWGPANGAFAMEYMRQCDTQGFIPTLEFYQLLDETGGGEEAVLAKVQNPTTMRGYFSDFKVLMQRAKEFNKPVLVLIETDGFGFLQKQSLNDNTTYGAIADTGLPELAGLPNTVAGWGLAFLQMRQAVGASNVILAIHVSGWASGQDIIHFALDRSLEAEVTKVHDFLKPFGLAPNVTGATYDVMVTDPLDRDADFFQLTQGQNRWWDASDSAPLNSRSFNRYAEWLRLWNVATGKRWILWQLPLGNSHHLNVANTSNVAREGYKDNRAEYFFGPDGLAHLEKFASSGVIALLFGQGEPTQSNYTNDYYSDGQLFMKSRAGNFLKGGGLAIPASATTSATSPPNAQAPKFTSSAVLSSTSVPAGGTVDITATVTATGGPLSGGIVNIEIRDAAGAKVGQQIASGQYFFYGQSRSYQYTWTVPAPGTYSVKIGVSNASWYGYHWNSAAYIQGAEPAPSADSAIYSFESSAQSWTYSGAIITGVSASSVRAWAGNQSLAVSMAGTASANGVVYVLSPGAPVGSTITFRLWVPPGHRISGVQPFVQEDGAGAWRWTDKWYASSALVAGAWNTLTVQVPANAVVPLHRLGLKLYTDATWTDTLAVDSVSW